MLAESLHSEARPVFNAEAIRVGIATGLVILLFPCFYLYNAGLANGWFPQFLGGWYGPVSLIIGLPFLLYLAIDIIRFRGRVRGWVGISVCIIVSYYYVWASIYTLSDSVYGQAVAMYLYVIEFLLLWFVTYTAFRHFNYSSTRVAWLLFALWVAIFVIAVAGQQNGMYYAASSEDSGDMLRIASYQGFARSALVVTALIMVRLSGLKMILFALSAFVLLFLLGARTEFVGVALIIFMSFIAGRGHLLAKACMLIFAAILSISLIAHFSTLIYHSRIDNLFHLEKDASWQTRQLFGSYAEATIHSHWLLGAYGSEIQHGGMGSYAHNALSAWVSFGLLGFLLFVGLNLACVGYMLIVTIKSGLRTTGLVQFALVMAIYAVVCMTFAKSVSDPIFAVSWGATAAVVAKRGVGLRKV